MRRKIQTRRLIATVVIIVTIVALTVAAVRGLRMPAEETPHGHNHEHTQVFRDNVEDA